MPLGSSPTLPVAIPTPSESAALRVHSSEPGWWFRAKEAIAGEFLEPYLTDRSSVLVLGCGGGATVAELRRRVPGCRIVGCDVDPAAIADCRRRDSQGIYQLVDLETALPALEAGQDLVVALDILEHLHDDAAALRGAWAALRPGGVLAVNVPAHPWLYGPHDAHLGHVRRYRPAEIEARVAEPGFVILHSTPLFMTTLLLLGVWRPVTKLSMRLSNRSDVGRRLPRALDRTLYAIARLEGRVARVGLPFGSSHFVLARRP